MQSATATTATTPVPFFVKVKNELKKLFRTVPGWEASAAATFTYIAPMVEALCDLLEPEGAPAVALLLTKIQSALAAAAVVVKDAGPKATLQTYLHAMNQDLADLEAAAGIKDPAAVQKISASVQLLTGEINAVLDALQTAQAACAAQQKTAAA